MTTSTRSVDAAVHALRRDHGLPVDPSTRGPVPLDRVMAEVGIGHVALPDLTLGAVESHLRAEGIPVEGLGDPAQTLAGFVFVAGRVGRAFVNATDVLVRRRFTAAHELGHAVLHRDRMGRYRADVSITESADEPDELEREANRFAAVLLMPPEVCEARAEELFDKNGCCPRGVLTYRLAAELLVSREAMRYRLADLEVGDE
jgi:hypothetical protein